MASAPLEHYESDGGHEACGTADGEQNMIHPKFGDPTLFIDFVAIREHAEAPNEQQDNADDNQCCDDESIGALRVTVHRNHQLHS